MDKCDYIEIICLLLRGSTGTNFQSNIKYILKNYYKTKNKTYEMPDFYGGDCKNDGWVVEDSLFYQIYAPARIKNASLKKDMQKKFKEDLSGLLDVIYEQHKWNGNIKKFIFIVNTLDLDLPQDSERFYEKQVRDFENKFGIKFECDVVNCDYIKDILYEIEDINVLERITAELRVRKLIDLNSITETMIIELIEGISDNINSKYLNCDFTETYERISTVKKIHINDLDNKKEDIEKIISKLDVVEKAVKDINQDVACSNKFERVKNLIIDKYLTLSNRNHGVALYHELIEEILSHSHNGFGYISVEFLIVYVFDKCDIFEKEEGHNNDIAK